MLRVQSTKVFLLGNHSAMVSFGEICFLMHCRGGLLLEGVVGKSFHWPWRCLLLVLLCRGVKEPISSYFVFNRDSAITAEIDVGVLRKIVVLSVGWFKPLLPYTPKHPWCHVQCLTTR